MHRFRDPADGQLYLHTKFQPFDAHRVFPCFDQPDLKGRFTFEVTAPASWRVCTNTAAVEVTTALGSQAVAVRAEPAAVPVPRHGRGRPIRAVGAERDGVPMTLYARPSLMDALTRDAGELLDITAEGLAFFAEPFGHPYPFGKYDLVFAPEYNFGAMEHPGAVTANERFLFTSRVTQESRRRRSEVLLHEMAHMWFGNLVTPRWWNDLWLSESFAVWAAATAQAATERYAAAWVWFAHDADVTARRADQLSGGQPVAVEAPDTMAARMAFNPITYRKGAALLRQLAAELGARPVPPWPAPLPGHVRLGQRRLRRADRRPVGTGGDLRRWAQVGAPARGRCRDRRAGSPPGSRCTNCRVRGRRSGPPRRCRGLRADGGGRSA